MGPQWSCCLALACLLSSCASELLLSGDDELQDPGTEDASADELRSDDVPTRDVPDHRAPPCAGDCDAEGALACSEDDRSVLECADEGTVGAPCLQWTYRESCLETEACESGRCVPRETGCCTVAGIGCCEGTDDCCEDDAATEGCRVRDHIRNGSEACDDSIRVALDPVANRYFLLCLNERGGTAYVSTNSGGPCGDPYIERCQCWEEEALRPWDELDYVARLVCDHVGKRLEVDLPSAGPYHYGTHPVPGDYNPLGYCPRGNGCMTCAVLLEIPRD
ncbi:MAG: hypothetical protein JXB32_01810 [Deltaproteobacteria bacterium]|nr:hypothetical protein [Deltaproteobacteria bacterium]